MNTSGKNAPATVISIVLLVAALLIATLSRGAGLFLSYLLPGSRAICHRPVRGRRHRLD
jgi:hypothetical protein